MTSLDPLERVVSTLARDPNLPRIKKLLYCACYGVWEDSAERLNRVSLQEIVQGVWERSPTLEALQFQLNRVVKTLNKPVAYAHVANGVLAVLNELYFDTYDITQPVMVNRVQFPLSNPGASHAGQSPAPVQPGQGYPASGYSSAEPAHRGNAHATPQGQQSYDPNYAGHHGHYPNSPAEYAQEANASSESPSTQWFVGGEDRGKSFLTPAQLSAQTAVRAHVLQSLAQHREQRRMKKLLVCVCHNQWENNRSHLAALDWELLLDDARQLMPTLQGFEHVLKAIVNSVSKPMEYQQVAQLLLEIVTPLYEQERPDETQFFGVMPEPIAKEDAHRPNPSHYGGQGRGVARNVAPSHAGPTHTAPAASNFRSPYPHASVGMSAADSAWRTSNSIPNASAHGGFPEANDEPPTGLFVPQLPASPMDSKYPPRELPNGGGYAGDALTESTAAIAPVAREDAAAHPMGWSSRAVQGGANTHNNAQDWGGGESQALRSDDSGVTSEEEVEHDEFTLRLSLMRYANPLMCKVVIFSALYHLFRFSEQDWIELRRYSLASLLGELEERYPNLIDLEMKLCGVAEQLEVPEQAMQTVAALLKVLKPRYGRAKQAPARDMGLAIATQAASRPVGVDSFHRAEKATAIQFGPEGEVDAIATQTAIADPETPAQSVVAEILPSEVISRDALISDDLEADLALLAASLEDDGPSLTHNS